MAHSEITQTIADDLLPRLHRLREWARTSAPPRIYIDLADACTVCEVLINPDGDWNKTTKSEDVLARPRRQGIHLVEEQETD